MKVLSAGASVPSEDIASPTWRLSAHPTVESLMEASCQRLDQLLSPFLLFSSLGEWRRGWKFQAFQPQLGLSGDQKDSPSGSHPGGHPALLKQKKKRKKDVPGVITGNYKGTGFLWSTVVRLGLWLQTRPPLGRMSIYGISVSIHPPPAPTKVSSILREMTALLGQKTVGCVTDACPYSGAS